MVEHFLHSEVPMANIFRNLDRLRSHNIGDVKIICRDGTVLAHKIILASVSQMLQKEFSGNFRDEILSISAPDVDRESVSRCLDSLYNRREVSSDETFINLICGKKEDRRQAKIEEVVYDEDEDVRLVEDEDNGMEENEKDSFSLDEENGMEDIDSGEAGTSYINDWIASPDKTLNEEPEDQSKEKDLKNVQPLSSSGKRDERRSVVWQHFVRISREDMTYLCQCNHCGQTVKSVCKNTTQLWRHLKSYHPEYQTMPTPTVIKFTSEKFKSVKEERVHQGSSTLDYSDAEDEAEELLRPKKNHIVPQRSVIWRHFMQNPEDRTENMCLRCGKIITFKRGTNSLFLHLQNYHMEKHYNVEKYFSISPAGAKCNYCDHVEKRTTNSARFLTAHVSTKHPDIYDRAENIRSYKILNRKGIGELPIVKPLYDNFEEARALTMNTSEKRPKTASKNEFAWSHFIKKKDPVTGKKSVDCFLCGKAFTQAIIDCRVLLAHLYKYHQIKDPEEESQTHVCSHCGKSFALRKYLVAHEWYHKEREPYQCSKCEKTFKTSGGLRLHEHLHSGEKPFQEC